MSECEWNGYGIGCGRKICRWANVWFRIRRLFWVATAIRCASRLKSFEILYMLKWGAVGVTASIPLTHTTMAKSHQSHLCVIFIAHCVSIRFPICIGISCADFAANAESHRFMRIANWNVWGAKCRMRNKWWCLQVQMHIKNVIRLLSRSDVESIEYQKGFIWTQLKYALWMMINSNCGSFETIYIIGWIRIPDQKRKQT